jgi:hypothetical protein
MKYETLFIMVRVQVHTSHTQISEIVKEVESHSKLNLSDTANVNILETEILLSRVANPSKINRQAKTKTVNLNP